MCSTDINIHLYRKAFDFAAEAHCAQKIPGTDIPYVHHAVQVFVEAMDALSRIPKSMCPDFTMQCALLHDVLEDTDVTEIDLEENFGKAVTEGVKALTKDISLPKKNA